MIRRPPRSTLFPSTPLFRSDPARLRAVVPAPLEPDEPVVKYEFIRMPDSTGFGDYTESGQVIPVQFQGRKGRSEEHTSELQSRQYLVCRLLLEKKKTPLVHY